MGLPANNTTLVLKRYVSSNEIILLVCEHCVSDFPVLYELFSYDNGHESLTEGRKVCAECLLGEYTKHISKVLLVVEEKIKNT